MQFSTNQYAPFIVITPTTNFSQSRSAYDLGCFITSNGLVASDETFYVIYKSVSVSIH